MNALVEQPRRTVAQVQPVLIPTNFDQLVTFAEMASNTEMVPKDFRNKPGNIMLAVQMGSELGLSPMQSLANIAIVNGRAGVWGDALIGICRTSPLCEDIAERIEGEGDERTAICIARRRGATASVGRFSVADAKKAELWGKDIWKKYPDRMLQNRARGFALRDAFPDLLRGLKPAEELLDTPPDTAREAFTGPTIEAPKPVDTGAGTKRRTVSEYLDGLDRELVMVPDADAADALLNSKRIEEAKGFCRGEARNRLADWIARAQRKVATLRAEEAKADDAAEAKIETPAPPQDGLNDEIPTGTDDAGWPGGDLVIEGEKYLAG